MYIVTEHHLLQQENADLKVEVDCLRRALKPLAEQRLSYETEAVNAVYLTPAEDMRRRASAIEELDNQIKVARHLLETSGGAIA